jgi:hypothetical protein
MLAGTAIAALLALAPRLPAAAQETLAAVVIRGPSNGTPAGATPLIPGQRVQSPAGTWTEIAFADGTSVVLEPGAAFTLLGVARDPATGRLVVRARSDRGRVRVSTSDGVEMLLVTPGAELRIVQAAAVVQAGPGEGSATLVSGRSLVVRRADGSEEVVRRPGFAVAFDAGGPQRRTRGQLAAAVDPFAPVERREVGAEQPVTVQGTAAVTQGNPSGPVLEGRRLAARDTTTQQRNGSERQETPTPEVNLPLTPTPITTPTPTPTPIITPTPAPAPIVTPTPTPIERRSGGSFDLAQGVLGGGAVNGSELAAGGAIITRSTSQNFNADVDPSSPEQLQVTGIEARQPFGTARVRILPPLAGAPGLAGSPQNGTGSRRDTGVVTVGARTDVVGGFFSNLTSSNLAPNGQAVFDAVAPAGGVTLNAFSAPFLVGANGSGPFANIVETPRIGLGDAGTPAATIYTFSFGVGGGEPVDVLGTPRPRQASYLFPDLSLVNGGQFATTAAFVAAMGAAIARNAIAPDSPSIIQIDNRQIDVLGTERSRFGLYRFPDGTLVNGQAIGTDSGFVAAMAAALQRNGLRPDTMNVTTLANVAVYRGSALYELGLLSNPVQPLIRPRQDARLPDGTEVDASSLPPDFSPTRAADDGRISLLASGSALLVYSAETPLPALQVTRPTTVSGQGGVQPRFNPCGDASVCQGVLPQGRTVFVLDAVVPANDPGVTSGRFQGGERFLAIGGTPIPPAAEGLPGMAAGTVARFAVSDGIHPQGGFRVDETVATQFVAPGDEGQPRAFNRFNAFRPDETFANRPADPLARPTGRGDTHLLVIAREAGTPRSAGPALALRSDLEVTASGLSSFSVSVGGIDRYTPRAGGAESLVLSGATVGSARLDAGRASQAILSAFGSLGTDATGAGEHMFPVTRADRPRLGDQIGTFLVGEADVRAGEPVADLARAAEVQRGNVAAIYGDDAYDFAFTRLATNVGTPSAPTLPFGPLPITGPNGSPLPDGGRLRGFATGVVESVTSGSIALFSVSTPINGDMTITPFAAMGGREFEATISLQPLALGEIPIDLAAALAPEGRREVRTVRIGPDPAHGSQPRTAVASPATFGGIAPGRAALASVDNDLLRGVRRQDNSPAAVQRDDTGRITREGLPSSNEHLAWGYFLGDVANEANGTRRDHISLGFWVAGRPVDVGTLETLRGASTYGGGMIGTVAEARAQGSTLRTVAGDFTKTWNFTERRGSMTAHFDQRSFSITNSAMPAGSATFAGSGAADGRIMSVQGGFFHNPATGGTLSATNHPQAVGGIFGVRGTGYGANGVFVGQRR